VAVRSLTGVEIVNSSVTIYKSIVESNMEGVVVLASPNFTMHGTIVAYNTVGLRAYNTSGGLVYGNAFINNVQQVALENSVLQWNSTYYGNYWSDYKGVDADGDGVGDQPYTIDEYNVDWKPLVRYPPLIGGQVNTSTTTTTTTPPVTETTTTATTTTAPTTTSTTVPTESAHTTTATTTTGTTTTIFSTTTTAPPFSSTPVHTTVTTALPTPPWSSTTSGGERTSTSSLQSTTTFTTTQPRYTTYNTSTTLQSSPWTQQSTPQTTAPATSPENPGATTLQPSQVAAYLALGLALLVVVLIARSVTRVRRR
ncbi:NosD domain-containing protein, partial [Thermogladius sp.]|uniref:NosD domain-containing protein n=1 Tax=Thermogladius sp. TaxID=2023064 RepID=UPI003D14EA73